MKHVLVFWLGLPAFAAGPLQDLIDDLTAKGSTVRPPHEIVLLGEFPHDEKALLAWSSKYESYVQDIHAGDEGKGSPKKRARQLLQRFLGNFKADDSAPGLTALLSKGVCARLTATFVFSDLCRRAGLDPKPISSDDLDPFWQQHPDPTSLAAAMLTRFAFGYQGEEPAVPMLFLEAASLLAPDAVYGQGTALYERADAFYKAKQYERAAYLAAGICKRYPGRDQFQRLCYNIGVEMMMAASDREQRLRTGELGQMLLPHTGTFREVFGEGLATLDFNAAVDLYNAHDWEAAVAELERMQQPPYPDTAAGLLDNAYRQLVQRYAKSGDGEKAREAWARLNLRNRELAAELEPILNSLGVKLAQDTGDLVRALTLAAQDLDSETGRKNYLAVLNRYNRALREQARFSEALSILNGVPEAVTKDEVVADLRYNTYAAWINFYEPSDFKRLLPIYERALADPDLLLDEKSREDFEENYANSLWREIEELIAERRFQDADRKSKKALLLAPDHRGLQQQRATIDQILKRGGK